MSGYPETEEVLVLSMLKIAYSLVLVGSMLLPFAGWVQPAIAQDSEEDEPQVCCDRVHRRL
ncbi:MAG: hypothetical protein HC899_16305 [Leptolyngbyaceae cyanobacterium SM1_4_3]|nr:hypothetical protein [Leptolyngbyaceae cyanobacterium SM1_4_3]